MKIIYICILSFMGWNIPTLRAQLGALRPLQGLLSDSSAMLVYSCEDTVINQRIVGKNLLWERAIRADKTQLREKIAQIDTYIRSQPEQGADEQKAEFVANLWDLSQLLFSCDSLLMGLNIRHLVLVPDSNLQNLPFELLLNYKASPRMDFQDFPFLIKDYQIQYLSQAQDLLDYPKIAAQANKTGKLMAFAPNYKNTVRNESRGKQLQFIRKTLQELDFTTKELLALQESYYGSYYFNEQATETAFKKAALRAEKYSILHFANHTVVEADSLLLVFAENLDTAQDNFLSIAELEQSQIKADLLVLSACELSKSENLHNLNLFDLSKQLLDLSPTLVLSRWQVNDVATVRIMEDFYDKIYHHQTVCAGLRAAQLSYLQQSKGIKQHPFYWANWLNLGDTNREIFVEHRNWINRYYSALPMVFIGLLAWIYVESHKEKIAMLWGKIWHK